MSEQFRRDLWHTRLCRYGPHCSQTNCTFAHRLCDLRAPNELDRFYESAWLDGVDRWFGQVMTAEQLQIIHEYSIRALICDLHQWLYGLRFIVPESESRLFGWYLQWDYGLSMDIELLCRHRGGWLPFEFMPHLWTILEVRRVELAPTMDDASMSSLEVTIT